MRRFFLFIIFVFSFLISGFAQSIKDIKPPVYFPFNYKFFFLFLLLIILIAVIIFFLPYLKRKKEKDILEPQLPKLSAYEKAREALKKLKNKNLPAAGKIKEYYVELSCILRGYLENRFRFKAPQSSTEEFLFEIKDNRQLHFKQKDLLKEFLSHCDIVKFGKYGPTNEEVEKSFRIAEEFITQTKQDNNCEQLLVK